MQEVVGTLLQVMGGKQGLGRRSPKMTRRGLEGFGWLRVTGDT